MPRPRTNDPSNLPREPNPTADPIRQAELLAEFHNRIDFIAQSYLVAREIIANSVEFNWALKRLKRSLNRKREARARGDRLSPEIELVISHHAQRLAEKQGAKVDGRHVVEAARHAASTLKTRRGRPFDRMLELHVRGLVAVIQEFSGKPVLARRYGDNLYDPHFASGVSGLVPTLFRKIDERVTVTQLVDIVRKTRIAYTGKPLRFIDLFPTYGTTIEGGAIKLPPGLRLERYEPNIPIYCP